MSQNSSIALIAAVIGGWVAGALLNYLADVLIQTRRLGSVRCYRCEQPSSLVDWLILRPCRHCGEKRSKRAWLVQMLAVIGLVALWLFPPVRLGFWVALPVFIYFGLVMIMDLEHRVVLHPVSLFGVVLGVLVGYWMNGVMIDQPLKWIQTTLVGGAGGFGIMLALYLGGELFRRGLSKLRGQEVEEVALGFGDVNLSGVLGLMVGWPRAWVMILGAVVLGGVVSGIYLLICVILRRYQAFTAIPYAPFLIITAVILFYLAPVAG